MRRSVPDTLHGNSCRFFIFFHSLGLSDTCWILCVACYSRTLTASIQSSQYCIVRSMPTVALRINFGNLYLFLSFLFLLRYKPFSSPLNLSLPYLLSSCWYTSLNPAKIPVLLNQSYRKQNSALPFRTQKQQVSPMSQITQVQPVTTIF